MTRHSPIISDRTVTPVYGFRDGRKETVAHLFDGEDAIDFVQANLGNRNLYLAPSIDRPLTGWEFAEHCAQSFGSVSQ